MALVELAEPFNAKRKPYTRPKPLPDKILSLFVLLSLTAILCITVTVAMTVRTMFVFGLPESQYEPGEKRLTMQPQCITLKGKKIASP